MRKVRGDRISMIFQEPMTSLNPVLTVGFQIAEALIYHRAARPQRRPRLRRCAFSSACACRRRASACMNIRIAFQAACVSA